MISRKKIVALLLLASTGTALPSELISQASIVDGDTLEMHGTRIRLWGIDAPESTQPAGATTASNIAAAQIRERSRHLHREPTSELHPDRVGSIPTDCCDLLGGRGSISANGW